MLFRSVSQSRYTPNMAQSVSWCFTINNPAENDLPRAWPDVHTLQKIEDYKKVIPSTSLLMLSKKLTEVQTKIVELM